MTRGADFALFGRIHVKSHHLGITVLGLLAAAGCGSSGSTTTDGGTTDSGGPIDSGTPTDTGTPSDGGSDVASSPLGFTPSNIDVSGFDLTTLGDVDITTNCGISTSEVFGTSGYGACGVNAPMVQFAIQMQSNGQKIGVWIARSWRIEPTATLTINGAPFDNGVYPLVIVATNTIDILGHINGGTSGNNPVGGGYPGSGMAMGSGPGAGGAANTAGGTNAGGGGSYCGIGGMGAALTGGMTAPGGPMYGMGKIVPLVAGSSGGGGTLGAGGGGPAIQLVAGKSITVEAMASVNVGGGGGSFGYGGGGGSGGALLLESPTVTIAGAIAANGGGGGSCGTSNSGADGLASNMPALGGTANVMGSPVQFGGNGSAGATTKGSDGIAYNTGPNPISCTGGGGGGAGYIRINTTTGMANTTGGTISPDLTTSCASQGMLH